jgi:hypothetical protein
MASLTVQDGYEIVITYTARTGEDKTYQDVAPTKAEVIDTFITWVSSKNIVINTYQLNTCKYVTYQGNDIVLKSTPADDATDPWLSFLSGAIAQSNAEQDAIRAEELAKRDYLNEKYPMTEAEERAMLAVLKAKYE